MVEESMRCYSPLYAKSNFALNTMNTPTQQKMKRTISQVDDTSDAEINSSLQQEQQQQQHQPKQHAEIKYDGETMCLDLSERKKCTMNYFKGEIYVHFKDTKKNRHCTLTMSEMKQVFELRAEFELAFKKFLLFEEKKKELWHQLPTN